MDATDITWRKVNAECILQVIFSWFSFIKKDDEMNVFRET